MTVFYTQDDGTEYITAYLPILTHLGSSVLTEKDQMDRDGSRQAATRPDKLIILHPSGQTVSTSPA